MARPGNEVRVTAPLVCYKQTWLRAGGGVEGKLGDGMASLMLNVTTEGAAPDMWLATAYHMAF